MRMSGRASVLLLPLPALRGRDWARGCFRKKVRGGTRGKGPLTRIALQADLSPRARRGQQRYLLERNGVHQAALGPKPIQSALELQRASLADIALEDLAVIAGHLDRLLQP